MPESDDRELEDAVARWAVSCRWEELPEPARRSVVQSTANVLALMVQARDHAGVRSVLRTGSDPVTRAMAWGLASHVEDFDDTDPATVLHPAGAVVAAALGAATAEEDAAGAAGAGSEGVRLLTAVAVGMEVAARVADGLHAALVKGWHVTGIAGTMGAAAAAGIMLGHSPRQLAGTLAFACSLASGLNVNAGTMTKSLHAGRAAAQGLDAALIVSGGLEVDARGALTRFLRAFEGDASSLAAVGTSWRVCDNTIKPYACGVLGHSILDLAIDAGRAAEAPLKAVSIRVNPLAMMAMGRREMSDGLAAKFSLFQCFAVGYVLGGGGVDEFRPENWTRPEVASVRSLVEIDSDPSLARYEARMRLTFADDSVVELGAPAPRRLTDDGLAAKLRTLLTADRGAQAAAWTQRLLHLDYEASLGDVIGLIRGPATVAQLV